MQFPSPSLKQVSTIFIVFPFNPPTPHPSTTDVTPTSPSLPPVTVTQIHVEATQAMLQGLSHLSRKRCATCRPNAKHVAHARTVSAQDPFGRGGAPCKGLSDYRQTSGLWDGRREWSAVRFWGRGDSGFSITSDEGVWIWGEAIFSFWLPVRGGFKVGREIMCHSSQIWVGRNRGIRDAVCKSTSEPAVDLLFMPSCDCTSCGRRGRSYPHRWHAVPRATYNAVCARVPAIPTTVRRCPADDHLISGINLQI